MASHVDSNFAEPVGAMAVLRHCFKFSQLLNSTSTKTPGLVEALEVLVNSDTQPTEPVVLQAAMATVRDAGILDTAYKLRKQVIEDIFSFLKRLPEIEQQASGHGSIESGSGHPSTDMPTPYLPADVPSIGHSRNSRNPHPCNECKRRRNKCVIGAEGMACVRCVSIGRSCSNENGPLALQAPEYRLVDRDNMITYFPQPYDVNVSSGSSNNYFNHPGFAPFTEGGNAFSAAEQFSSFM